MALKHAKVQRASDSALMLTDRLSGGELPVRPDVIVKATGAWVDQTWYRIEGPDGKRLGTTSFSVLMNEDKWNGLPDDIKQMFADSLGLPVTVAGCEETGALGAAIAAGIGADLFSGFDEGVAAMTRVARTHVPDSAARVFHDRRYRLYQALGEPMQPFWRELDDIRRATAPE